MAADKKVQWFSQMKMDSFNEFIKAWQKQTDTTRIFDSKHKTQLDDVRAGAELLQAINDNLTYRNKTNPDGSVEINPHTMNVEFNPILSDKNILDDSILKIRNAVTQIMENSSSRFKPGTELGTLAQGVINICNDFEKFHHDTKKDITKIALKDFYKNNKDSAAMPEKYLPSENKNQEWFDTQKIAAAQTLVDTLKERFAQKPEAEKYIKGIEDNLAVLTSINNDVVNNSAFKRGPTGSIANAKGEVTFSDKLDDPEISGASNGMITQKVLLTALNSVEPSSDPAAFKKNQEMAAENTALLNQLSQFAESIFKNHREKKQNFEDGFLKDFYQENHFSQPELSIASTTVNNSESSDVKPIDFSSSDSIDYSDLQIDVSDTPGVTPTISPLSSPRSSVSEKSSFEPSISSVTPPPPPVIAKPPVMNISAPIEKAPAASQATPKDDKINWFKYAVMTAGILLGAAAIATGVGAVIGVPLLAISAASMIGSIASSNRGAAMLDRMFGTEAPTAKTTDFTMTKGFEPIEPRKTNQSTINVLSQMKNFDKMKELQQTRASAPKEDIYAEVLRTAAPVSSPAKTVSSPAPAQVVANDEPTTPRMGRR